MKKQYIKPETDIIDISSDIYTAIDQSGDPTVPYDIGQ